LIRVAFAAAALFGLWGFGADSVNFDSVPPGTPPPNWTFVSRPNNRVRWDVEHDLTAPSRGNVLKKVTPGSSDSDNPSAIYDKDICRDGDISVKFRIDNGVRVKTAGIVWRYQDANNYYLLHFSVDEKNIVLFRVQNGRYQTIPVTGDKPKQFGIPHDIRARQWYVAKVIFRGSQIRVLFGNRRLFEAQDNEITQAGRIGLWTRGRTTASFDDFRIDKKS
jgi:hypothetical protein